MNDLAPIGLSTYSRLQHLQQTVEALKKNTLAHQSELHIFSDAPKSGDEEKVAAVRNYLRSIDGFKKIHIIERKYNNRVANGRGGFKMLLDRYGKAILLAEDVVTAPNFLSFMNQALDAYRDDEKVFAITGYCPPINTDVITNSDVFLLPACNLWGFAIWKEKFDKIRMRVPTFEILMTIGNPFSLRSYMRGGMDVPNMFLLDAQEKLDALDIKYSYEQWRRKSYLLIPKISMVSNIGFDGTGEHCGVQKKYDTVISNSKNEKFQLPDNLELNESLVEEYTKFRSGVGIVSQVRWIVLTFKRMISFLFFRLKRKMAIISKGKQN